MDVVRRAVGPLLGGTEYDLTTGEVIQWCPKNNPVRQLLGALKAGVKTSTPRSSPQSSPLYTPAVDP